LRYAVISQEDYKRKMKNLLSSLKNKFGNFYLVPEGGTNELAIKVAKRNLTEQDASYDYICCAIGTGGTISGLINSAKPNQKF
jgi:1-aminocyclopropane-1-carboxylate deaminase